MAPMFSASLMCMDFLDIPHSLDVINRECDFYHIDVMDGTFVKNLAISPSFLKSIRPAMKLPVDVHLMTLDPNAYIDALADAGADYISVHAETIYNDAFRTIQHICNSGCRVGIVINPATSIDAIRVYIKHIDLLTIMAFDPGFAAQPFVPETLDKVRAAVKLREELGAHYRIQIDGACWGPNYRAMSEAGNEIYIEGVLGMFLPGMPIEDGIALMKKEFAEKTA